MTAWLYAFAGLIAPVVAAATTYNSATFFSTHPSIEYLSTFHVPIVFIISFGGAQGETTRGKTTTMKIIALASIGLSLLSPTSTTMLWGMAPVR